ncbi:MAG: hypothetical protein JRI97_08730 [Deltaproteobacteria bacterium]|nr:hypothetical protein [Deltaproteobacteria bacterium]
MHLYWKVVEELKSMGEMVVFLDPGLKRCFSAWMLNHAESLQRAEDLTPPGEGMELPVSLN